MLAGYNYYQTRTITGSADGTQTNYQMMFVVYPGVGVNSANTIYLNGHSLTWGSSGPTDIRFCNSSDTVLPYWVDTHWSTGSVAYIWVLVDSIASGAGQTVLNIYYGKSGDGGAANASTTFPSFFDDFNSLNTSTVWTNKCTGDGVISVNAGALSINSGLSGTGGIQSQSTFGTGNAVVASVYSGTTNTDGMFGFTAFTNNEISYYFNPSSVNITPRNESGGTFTNGSNLGSPNKTSHHRYEVCRSASNGNVFRYDGSVVATITTNNPAGSIAIGGTQVSHSVGVMQIEWIAIRKYTYNEPTLTGFSGEIDLISGTATGGAGVGTMGLYGTVRLGMTAAGGVGGSNASIENQFNVLLGMTGTGGAGTDSLSLSNGPGQWANPLSGYKIYEVDISKVVTDAMWSCSLTIDNYVSLPTFTKMNVALPKLGGGSNLGGFVGFIPGQNNTFELANNKVKTTMFDYAWYLSKQFVPLNQLSTPLAQDPGTTITNLLGSTNWATTTGVNPYHIDTLGTAWGTTVPQIIFTWTAGTSIWSAIQQICAYCGYLFIVNWKLISTTWTPVAYFFPQTNIDSEYDILPAPVTFTYGSENCIVDYSSQLRQDEMYNYVMVRGHSGSTYFVGVAQTAAVSAGTTLPIMKYEESSAYTTQAAVNSRATFLLNYYQNTAQAINIDLVGRTDLALYQKVQFVGYTGIPAGWMRIVGIDYKYSISESSFDVSVSIQVIPDTTLGSMSLLFAYLDANITTEIATIANGIVSSLPYNTTGTITSLNGTIAQVLTSAGNTYTVQLIYSAPYVGDLVYINPDGTGGWYGSFISQSATPHISTSLGSSKLHNGYFYYGATDLPMLLGTYQITWDGTGHVYLVGDPGTSISNNLTIFQQLQIQTGNGTITTSTNQSGSNNDCHSNLWWYYWYSGVIDITSIMVSGVNNMTITLTHCMEQYNPACGGVYAQNAYTGSTNGGIYIIAR